jgi:O-methyltransferase involved in polyketide biosynthesis
MPDRIAPELTGVPETLLWPLYNRAEEARRPDGVLRDPHAVRIADAIDYPYALKFGPAARDSALRAARFDEQIRLYLRDHPEATVVGLGEGLETQVHRCDNGRVRWLAVDLPETIALRRRFLPDTERHRNLACSALDPAWMGHVDPDDGVVVTAQGLLMYFDESTVRGLIDSIARAFPGGWMILDTIPRVIRDETLARKPKTPDYTPPPMPWGLDATELQSIVGYSAHIRDVTEIPLEPPAGLSEAIRRKVKSFVGRVEPTRPAILRLRFR